MLVMSPPRSALTSRRTATQFTRTPTRWPLGLYLNGLQSNHGGTASRPSKHLQNSTWPRTPLTTRLTVTTIRRLQFEDLFRRNVWIELISRKGLERNYFAKACGRDLFRESVWKGLIPKPNFRKSLYDTKTSPWNPLLRLHFYSTWLYLSTFSHEDYILTRRVHNLWVTDL